MREGRFGRSCVRKCKVYPTCSRTSISSSSRYPGTHGVNYKVVTRKIYSRVYMGVDTYFYGVDTYRTFEGISILSNHGHVFFFYLLLGGSTKSSEDI